jgi:aryl-phospho-beta-D-glucosidase BglC (GH1 family)
MRFVVRLFWVLFGLGIVSGGWAQQGSSLASRRAQHLARGVNLSMWYAQTGDHSAEHINTFTTPADFKLIKSLGFDHVRVSINPEPLIAERQIGALRGDAMARLDRSVTQILAAGLNVILDIHPEEAWKDAMTKGDDGPQQFYAFWGTFAGHFAASDPDRVFFEVMNEPTVNDLYRWEGIQARAVERIRAVAPQHTVIATGAAYGGLEALLAMEPLRDDNVIYSFHYYEPFWFTHQGATWGAQSWVFLRNVPYPSTPENVQAVLGQEPDERPRLWLQHYGWDRWDAARIGADVAAIAQWAERRGVPLYLGEFGVYREYANPAMRDTWISDVRTAAESKHIGWCMWDYQSNFGVVVKSGSATEVDQGVVRALGLKQ